MIRDQRTPYNNRPPKTRCKWSFLVHPLKAEKCLLDEKSFPCPAILSKCRCTSSFLFRDRGSLLLDLHFLLERGTSKDIFQGTDVQDQAFSWTCPTWMMFTKALKNSRLLKLRDFGSLGFVLVIHTSVLKICEGLEFYKT